MLISGHNTADPFQTPIGGVLCYVVLFCLVGMLFCAALRFAEQYGLSGVLCRAELCFSGACAVLCSAIVLGSVLFSSEQHNGFAQQLWQLGVQVC